MVTDKISIILKDLSRLLDDGLSPQSISYQFEKIAVLLREENLPIGKTDCKEYYEDKDLSLILLMKNEAMENALFEQASKFRFIEMELLAEKGNNEFTQLRIEPFFFEYIAEQVIFHYNKRKENQRLIANLIERYNLIYENATSNKMPYY